MAQLSESSHADRRAALSCVGHPRSNNFRLQVRSIDMDKNKTASILQRLTLILAVTAASYGLAQPHAAQVQPR